MSCCVCGNSLVLFNGRVCVGCHPKWFNDNEKHLSLFGCVFDGCVNPKQQSLGLCQTHLYSFWDAGGKSDRRGPWFNPDMTRKRCLWPQGCEHVVLSRGLCGPHYRGATPEERDSISKGSVLLPKVDAVTGEPLPCSAPDCDKNVSAGGLCERHYKMFRKYGVTDWETYKSCPVSNCGRRMVRGAEICKRCNQFKWRYSLTSEGVKELFKPENYRCNNGGCSETSNLHLDHSHVCCPDGKFRTSHKKSCGKCVRGWLCRGCNLALGYLQENPQKIRGLILYLERAGV